VFAPGRHHRPRTPGIAEAHRPTTRDFSVGNYGQRIRLAAAHGSLRRAERVLKGTRPAPAAATAIPAGRAAGRRKRRPELTGIAAGTSPDPAVVRSKHFGPPWTNSVEAPAWAVADPRRAIRPVLAAPGPSAIAMNLPAAAAAYPAISLNRQQRRQSQRPWPVLNTT